MSTYYSSTEVDTATKMAFSNFDPEADKRLRVEFYFRPTLNENRSAELGRPVYSDTEFVRIIVPGDKDSIVDRPVMPVDVLRFRERYDRWKAGAEQAASGTPIGVLPEITPAREMELKHFGVTTVEQLADMADTLGQKFMGFQAMKTRAKEFLTAAKDSAGSSQLRAENELIKAELGAIKAQFADMQDQLAAQKTHKQLANKS